MAVTSSFIAATGLLNTTGDNLGNTITISRDAAGKLLVNGGAVSITGGQPTVANTSLIRVFGLGDNDVLSLNETTGALPAANLFGGAGNDTMTGGAGGDQVFGEAGNDTLLGNGGADFLFGGTESDVLTGGDGDDQMFGQAGDDRFIWNSGDDTDLLEGGDGTDTSEVNGDNGAEVFTVTANGARVRFDRLDAGPFSLDIGTTENLVLHANGGDDRFSATGNLAALIKLTVDGGAGNDTLLGSNGADTLLGGDGNDFLDGQQGNDLILLGAGDDVFQWDPGDGSDTVEGQDGADRMLFNGSAGNEIFEMSANGGRVHFTRNLGNIVMDLNDVERIDINALGGTDTTTINDLSGTDIRQVAVSLAGTIGGAAGDAAADITIVNSTNGGDTIDVVGAGTSVTVVGLSAVVSITQSEGANDSLVINALGGDDSITATTLPAGVVKLTIDGGAGDDAILGSQGADVFLGGAGDDFVFGDNGNDLALLGAGDDVFRWDPGDGNDTVEGQDGTDTLDFNGSGASEKIDIFANGGRALFFRDVADVTMDLDDVERIAFDALGGADTIVVGDLSGTDVTQVAVNLAGPAGGGDLQADTVTVNATQGDDVFGVVGDATGISVFGLQASVLISGAEGANDRLTLNAQGGDDVINASGLEAGAIQLTINAGLGEDIVVGSEGGDLVNGGDGDDVALMGAGNDTFVWNPGDDNDTVEGQDGIDTLAFNGANAAERIDIAADGGRVRFFRDIANVTMDLNDVETIKFAALGGADNIVVNDLSGTDVTSVDIDLAAFGGAGDAQADAVAAQATNGNDQIGVANSGGSVVVTGLAAQVLLRGAEAANDRLTINGLAGNDSISAFALPAGQINLTLNGGDGDDTIEGSAGNDVIDGGAGADILSFANAVAAVNVSLSGNLQVPGLGVDVITGIEGLRGSLAADTLGGDAGDNVLDGNGGADSMSGGFGNDSYIVDNAGDSVFEKGFGGADRILASVSYTLGAGVSVEELRTTNNSGTAAINLTGNELANAVTGNAGANTLDGKGGADAMAGLGGNDVYFADNAGDTVTEAVGGGSDRILASVSYALGAGQDIEMLTTTSNGGTAAIDLTGNALANAIFGNAGANKLDGRAGADTLVGFGGDDIFFVDNAGDQVIEAAGGGADRVFASVNYALGEGQAIETLSTTDHAGTAALRLTGNGFANTIHGNAGANVLDGKAGADTLAGFAGDDFFFVDNAGDLVVEAAGGGVDRILASVDYALRAGVQVEILSTDSAAGLDGIDLTGNELSNTLVGNAGSNALKGGLGNDVLFGGGGNDAFVFNTALGAPGSNIDRILDFNVADDSVILSRGVFTAAGLGVLQANAFFVGASANDADDRIVYNSLNGALLYDADGVGGAAAIQFATASAGLGLTHTDFIVV